MGLLNLVVCASSLSALSIAASAAPATLPTPQDSIVVTGNRASPAETRAAAQRYVRGVIGTPVMGQYARWKKPVCPNVIGLAPENAAIVDAKIRAVAVDAGVRVAKAGCDPNLDIVFTDDSEGQMRAILHRSKRMMKKMSAADSEALARGTQPVRWWYDTRIEAMDGHQAGGEPAALLNAQIEGGGPGFVSSGGDTQYLDGYSSSLIGTRMRVNVESAAIIVDTNRASGRTLSAVSAYVALIALAQIRMGVDAGDGDTLLRLFDKDAPAFSDLTSWDRAFLKAVYRTPPDRERRDQTFAIAGAMAKSLTE